MTTPSCRWTQEKFSDYKAGRLDRSTSDQLFAHLMYCASCRSELWQPEVNRFRASLQGGAWLADRAVEWRAEQYGHIPLALAASSKGNRARVGHARGLALLGDSRDQRVDVFCHATLVGGSPGSMKVRLPPALRLGGMDNPFRPVEEALLSLLPPNLPPVAVEVALDAAGPLPRQLLLAGDSLQLPVAISAASAFLDLAVRTDRVFTGALRGDGLLLEVGDLDQKLYLLPPGNRLVVPARNQVPPVWSDRVLVAGDLVQALDHAGATLPTGGVISLAAAGATSEVAAVRATLERLPIAGIVLAFPPGNPTGAPLWYLSSRAGMVALIPGHSDDVAADAIAAVRGAAKKLRADGVLARDRVPFPLRGFALAPEGETSTSRDILDSGTWMQATEMAGRIQIPIKGRGLLPFATAQTLAQALWQWGGGSAPEWERALPQEPSLTHRAPGLKIGKIRRALRSGSSHETHLPEPGPAKWCDPDFSLPARELTRHLFVAGSRDDGAGACLRVAAEAAVRSHIPAVVLDLDGGLASLAIPASRGGLAAVSERLPGAETWLRTKVEGRKPWPGESKDDVATVPVRVTFPDGGAPPLPPPEGLGPELWVIDAHRRPRAAKARLVEAWSKRLSQVATQTVHPGRPNCLLVINAGTILAPDGGAAARRSLTQLLKAGPSVGVAVLIAVRSPGDLDPALAALCHGGLIGSPGAAGRWPKLPESWEPLAPVISRLGAQDLLFRTPDQLAVVQPRSAASLPLPDAPVDLLERFALAVDGSREAPVSQATVLPDVERAEATLIEAGVLLPKVPFLRQVAGYTIALGSRGEVGGDPDSAIGHLSVRREDGSYRVSLVSEGEQLLLDGETLPRGQAVTLTGSHQLTVAGRPLSYTYHARRHEPEGWPYVAEIQGIEARSWPVEGTLLIGRDVERCQITLPDRKTQADLIWNGDGQPPAGSENITLDAIYASGLHGELRQASDAITVQNRSSRTAIYLRRGGQLTTIGARETSPPIVADDEILMGQRVFRWKA